MFNSGLRWSQGSIAILTLACWVTMASSDEIEAILIHAPFIETFSCTEHYAGQFKYPGDALGTDCAIGRLVEESGRKWLRQHENNGLNNEDWFGWRANILAPCNCTIEKVRLNLESTLPGILGKPPSSSITFKSEDGTHILFAHIADPLVEVGDEVRAGQVVASVGNNGYSRQPHLHIGAWRAGVPLQIRFDQKTMGPNIKPEEVQPNKALHLQTTSVTILAYATIAP